jgi:hypothetical protein
MMGRRPVGEFEAVLRERVAEAVAALRTARASGDVEASQQAADQLGNLLMIAAEHGVNVGAELGVSKSDDAGGS